MYPVVKHYRYASFLLISVLALSLSGYPLVASMTSLLGIENRPVAIGFRLILLLTSVFLILAILANHVRIYRGWVWIPILVFWTLYVIRLWLDTKILSAPLSREPVEYWIWSIGCLIPMVALMAKPDSVTSSRALGTVFWLTAAAVFLVLLATRIGVVAGISRTLETGRLEISALNPISAGHLGGSLMLIATHLFLGQGSTQRFATKRVMYLAFVLVGLILLVVSGSRGAIGATAISVVIFSIAKLRRKGGGLAMVFIVLLAAGSYQLATFVEDQIGLLPITRLVSGLSPESDAGASNRFQLAGDAWNQFADAPAFGSGLEELNSGDYPHNVIVESFMATGIIGGLAFTLVFVMAVLTSWRLLNSTSSQNWLAPLCIQYLVGAQFSGSLWGNTVMWALIGATFGAYVPPGRKNRSAGFSLVQRKEA